MGRFCLIERVDVEMGPLQTEPAGRVAAHYPGLPFDGIDVG